MKTVSFLVPCYNSEAYMRTCIDSLLGNPEQVEIIIVNDGSSDQTGIIANEYQEKYPDTVTVIHKENGGHGSGIMAGVKIAKGYFFKVVDSDDWLDKETLPHYIDTLNTLKQRGDVQLVVNDYVYEYNGVNKQDSIIYSNVFHSNKVQTFEDSRSFAVNQYLTIHSCTYQTDVLRECNLDLPSHTFYEDNLYIYKPLPFVKNLYYMNAVLYHYYIGRPGQSMEEDNIKKRCDHQILVSKLIFSAYDIKQISKERPKLGRIMLRENVLMLTAATIFARLNRDKESELKVRQMWRELSGIDAYVTRLIKYRSMAFFVTIPGRLGRSFAIFNYRAAHKVLKFN